MLFDWTSEDPELFLIRLPALDDLLGAADPFILLPWWGH